MFGTIWFVSSLNERIRVSLRRTCFFNDPAPTEIYTLSHTTLFRSVFLEADVHKRRFQPVLEILDFAFEDAADRSEEHTSELQSLRHLVCRLLLEKKKELCQKQMLQSR